MKPVFFPTPSDFRKWLTEHHEAERELWVAYYKKATERQSITWPESVDQALCFGWIDGIRKSLGDESYTIRFTPRRPKSIWSAVNIKRIQELKGENLVMDAAWKHFELLDPAKSERYSYERKNVKLPDEYEALIRANKTAWEFYEKLPPSTKKPSMWWVVSAKKEETKMRRLHILIESSEAGMKIPPLRRKRE